MNDDRRVRETPADYRVATYDDVLAAPPHLVAELIDGRLHTQPRPRPRHAYAIGRLFSRLDGVSGGGFDGGGGNSDDDGGGGEDWFFLIEPELHLGREVLVPDVAGWRGGRAPIDPDAVGVATPPDWICEVLSPSTRKLDETRKADIYAAHGVEHLWLIDPEPRLMTAFERDGARWVRLGAWSDADEAAAPPFDALKLSLAALWMAPAPETDVARQEQDQEQDQRRAGPE